MKYGMNTLIFTGSFRDEHAELFPRLKKIGFDGVEIAPENKGDFDTLKMRKALESNGLVCSSICGLYGPGRDLRSSDPNDRKGGVQYTKDCIDMASELGAKFMVGPIYSSVGRAGLETEEARKEQWGYALDGFKEVAEHAEKKDVYLGIEPLNRFETDFINIAEDALRMCNDVGSSHLGLHLDTFHMNIEEKDSGKAIRTAGDKLFLLHASENDRGAPGTGQVPWQKVRDAVKEIGFDGWVVIESFTPDVEMIARAAAIWRQTEKDADTLASKGLSFLRQLFG